MIVLAQIAVAGLFLATARNMIRSEWNRKLARPWLKMLNRGAIVLAVGAYVLIALTIMNGFDSVPGKMLAAFRGLFA